MKNLKILLIFVIAFSFFSACSDLKQLAQTYNNLKNLKFKLQNINNFHLNGIDISNKKSVSDFSLTDGAKLLQLFNSKKLPCDFVLNVMVMNPNESDGGKKQITSTITKLDWRLYIDDKLTISGDINKAINIPGSGQSTIIPLNMKLDLIEFFGNKGYSDILNLALALGGVNNSTSRIKLDILPTLNTPLGPLTYPQRITVIDKEFNGK